VLLFLRHGVYSHLHMTLGTWQPTYS